MSGSARSTSNDAVRTAASGKPDMPAMLALLASGRDAPSLMVEAEIRLWIEEGSLELGPETGRCMHSLIHASSCYRDVCRQAAENRREGRSWGDLDYNLTRIWDLAGRPEGKADPAAFASENAIGPHEIRPDGTIWSGYEVASLYATNLDDIPIEYVATLIFG